MSRGIYKHFYRNTTLLTNLCKKSIFEIQLYFIIGGDEMNLSNKSSIEKIAAVIEQELYNRKSEYLHAVRNEARKIVTGYVSDWIVMHLYEYGSNEPRMSPEEVELMKTELKPRIETATRYLIQNSETGCVGSALEMALNRSSICNVLRKYKLPAPQSSGKMEDDDFIGVTEEYGSRELRAKQSELNRVEYEFEKVKEGVMKRISAREKERLRDSIRKSLADL